MTDVSTTEWFTQLLPLKVQKKDVSDGLVETRTDVLSGKLMTTNFHLATTFQYTEEYLEDVMETIWIDQEEVVHFSSKIILSLHVSNF